MISTIIFDFDGTLASTLEGIHACMAEAFLACGFPSPSLSDVRSTVGLTLEESVWQLAGAESAAGKIADLVKMFRGLYRLKAPGMTSLFPGARDVLAQLRSGGVQLIVVSNKSRQGLERLAEQLGITEYLDAILGALDAPFHKPDGRLFTESIVPLLANPAAEEVLVVGDTEWDLLFARNAGAKSCWAAYGYGDPEKCRALRPHYVIAAITELPKLVFP